MAKKVLIVDDEPGLLKVMDRILSDLFQITTASGGQEAMDKLHQEKGDFDVIVCDLNMPTPNGRDVFYYVESHFPALKQQFIFMTGGSFTQEMSDFVKSNPNPYLEKPFANQDLIKKINECLQTHEVSHGDDIKY